MRELENPNPSLMIAGFHTGFLLGGEGVFSHASTKHVNVGEAVIIT